MGVLGRGLLVFAVGCRGLAAAVLIAADCRKGGAVSKHEVAS